MISNLTAWLAYGWRLLESAGGHASVEILAGLLGGFAVLALVSTCKDWLNGL